MIPEKHIEKKLREHTIREFFIRVFIYFGGFSTAILLLNKICVIK